MPVLSKTHKETGNGMGALEGKRILVTAAGQGIGRAAAEACLQGGALVTATDLNAAAFEGWAAPGLTTGALDVTDETAVFAMAGDGRWDAVIHCAGFVHGGTVLDITQSDFDFAMSLNLRSAVTVSQAVLPAMRSAGGGALVFISSVASSMKGVPNRALYSASKAALIGLCKSIAADFVSEGIRANCVCPGTVDTPSLGDRIRAQGGDPAAVRQAFVDRQPMGRLGTAEEVGRLSAYLASAEADFITGQAIAIDGGWSL